MTPRQPMAPRPLALLTLAVAGVHLLLLSTPFPREARRPAATKALVTRAVHLVPAANAPAAASETVFEQRTQARQPATAARIPPPGRVRASPVSPTADRLTDNPAPPAPTSSAAQAMALAIPGPVHLRYDVTGQSRGRAFAGAGRLWWRHDGDVYEARLDVPTAQSPTRSHASSGRITAEGLTPRRFAERSRGEQATHFEHDKGTLVFSSNAPQQQLDPGTQDRLSVYLQLAAMLAAEPARFPVGTGISVHTVGSRDAQPWLFTVEADEALDLPGGTVATRKLVRQPRGEYDIRIELWLGTSMDYMPVRLRLTQPNGDYVDQQWASTDRP